VSPGIDPYLFNRPALSMYRKCKDSKILFNSTFNLQDVKLRDPFAQLFSRMSTNGAVMRPQVSEEGKSA